MQRKSRLIQLMLLRKSLRGKGRCRILLFGASPIICILCFEMMDHGVCSLFVMCVNSGPLEGHGMWETERDSFLCCYHDAVTATASPWVSILPCTKIEQGCHVMWIKELLVAGMHAARSENCFWIPSSASKCVRALGSILIARGY